MPTLTSLRPPAALPGAEIEVLGSDLGPGLTATIAGEQAQPTLLRETRAIVRVPEGLLAGDVVVSAGGMQSNALRLEVAVPMAENLHPVANPAVDRAGNVYTTLSGSRGQQTPVSIFQIAPAPEGVVHTVRPFAREILNPSGLAFGPDGRLFCSSRADGIVYAIDAEGKTSVYAEGLGVATGIAFDEAGDLYVGDRSGTIFKIRAARPGGEPETFVFATHEPSIAAYHLAFNRRGTLFVTAPTTSSSQAIHTFDRDGTPGVFFRGLGRPQGLAFDPEDTLHVAASLAGERGIVRITPDGTASLAVAGSNCIGLCFLPEERLAITTRDTIYALGRGAQ